MSYMETISRAFSVLGFSEQGATELANDDKATGHGFLTLALIGLISGLVSALYVSFFSPAIGAVFSVFSVLFSPVVYIIGFIIGYSIYHFFAKIFGGQATGSQYFRVMSNVMMVGLLGVIPIIGNYLSFLVGLYLIAINMFVLNKVHKLSWVKAVIVALLPLILLVGFVFVAGVAFFTSVF